MRRGTGCILLSNMPKLRSLLIVTAITLITVFISIGVSGIRLTGFVVGLRFTVTDWWRGSDRRRPPRQNLSTLSSLTGHVQAHVQQKPVFAPTPPRKPPRIRSFPVTSPRTSPGELCTARRLFWITFGFFSAAVSESRRAPCGSKDSLYPKPPTIKLTRGLLDADLGFVPPLLFITHRF